MKQKGSRINVVTSNTEKGFAFQAAFDRYNKAQKAKCYLECIWILYAVLEDRTSAFLYYLGFTAEGDRSKITASKRYKADIRQILNLSDTAPKYRFNTLSGKLSQIIQTVEWSAEPREDVTTYQQKIQNAVNRLRDHEELLAALHYLNEEWRDKRNELIHAFCDKDPLAADEVLLPLAEKGYTEIRRLNKAVEQIKKAKIREQFKVR